MAADPIQRTYTCFAKIDPDVNPSGFTGGLGRGDGPVLVTFTPSRGIAWDVLRVWAYSTGYEAQAPLNAPSQPSVSYDPYIHNRYSGVGGALSDDANPYQLVLYAGLYKNNIALESLVQPFFFVPRSFEPLALQQTVHVRPEERLLGLVTESIGWGYTGGLSTLADRAGRGVTFGIDVMETYV